MPTCGSEYRGSPVATTSSISQAGTTSEVSPAMVMDCGVMPSPRGASTRQLTELASITWAMKASDRSSQRSSSISSASAEVTPFSAAS